MRTCPVTVGTDEHSPLTMQYARHTLYMLKIEYEHARLCMHTDCTRMYGSHVSYRSMLHACTKNEDGHSYTYFVFFHLFFIFLSSGEWVK